MKSILDVVESSYGRNKGHGLTELGIANRVFPEIVEWFVEHNEDNPFGWALASVPDDHLIRLSRAILEKLSSRYSAMAFARNEGENSSELIALENALDELKKIHKRYRVTSIQAGRSVDRRNIFQRIAGSEDY